MNLRNPHHPGQVTGFVLTLMVGRTPGFLSVEEAWRSRDPVWDPPVSPWMDLQPDESRHVSIPVHVPGNAKLGAIWFRIVLWKVHEPGRFLQDFCWVSEVVG